MSYSAWGVFSSALGYINNLFAKRPISDVKWYKDFHNGDTKPVVGGRPTFIRDTAAYQYNNSLYIPKIVNQPRFQSITRWNGEPVVGLLLEPATEQQIADPFDFSTANWTLSGATRTSIPSLVKDENAHLIQGTASTHYITSDISTGNGTMSGEAETLVFVVEQKGIRSSCDFHIRNNSGGSIVWRFTWATETLTKESETTLVGLTQTAEKLVTRNGQEVWIIRLTYEGNVGGHRIVRFYPYGAGSGASSVALYYVGIEENAWGSNPLFGPNNTVQDADALSYEQPPEPSQMIWYERFTAGQDEYDEAEALRIADVAPSLVKFEGRKTFYSDHWTGTNGAAWAADWTSTAGTAGTLSSNTGKMKVPSETGHSTMELNYTLDDFDYTVTITFPDSTGDAEWSIQSKLHFRSRGDASAVNPQYGYYLNVTGGASGGEVAIKRSVNRTTVYLSDSLTGIIPQAGGTFKVRVNMDGPLLRAKIWLTSVDEPTDWQLEATDYTYASGKTRIELKAGWSGAEDDAHREAKATFYDDLTIKTAKSGIGALYKKSDRVAQAVAEINLEKDDDVEIATVFTSTGDLRVVCRKNGGQAVDSGLSSWHVGIDSSWGGDKELLLPNPLYPVRRTWDRLFSVADTATPAKHGNPNVLLDELSSFRLGPNKEMFNAVSPPQPSLATPRLLDLTDRSLIGYSVRQLSRNAEYALQVYANEPDDYLDIGFDGEDLDVETLLDFAGAGDARVVKWYNQSPTIIDNFYRPFDSTKLDPYKWTVLNSADIALSSEQCWATVTGTYGTAKFISRFEVDDFELTMKVTYPAGSGAGWWKNFSIQFRLQDIDYALTSSSWSIGNGYMMTFEEGASSAGVPHAFFYGQGVGDITDAIAIEDIPTLANESTIRFKLRVTGSTMKVKMWVDGDAEPENWTLEATDSNYSGPGPIGFVLTNGETGSIVFKLDDLVINVLGHSVNHVDPSRDTDDNQTNLYPYIVKNGELYNPYFGIPSLTGEGTEALVLRRLPIIGGPRSLFSVLKHDTNTTLIQFRNSGDVIGRWDVGPNSFYTKDDADVGTTIDTYYGLSRRQQTIILGADDARIRRNQGEEYTDTGSFISTADNTSSFLGLFARALDASEDNEAVGKIQEVIVYLDEKEEAELDFIERSQCEYFSLPVPPLGTPEIEVTDTDENGIYLSIVPAAYASYHLLFVSTTTIDPNVDTPFATLAWDVTEYVADTGPGTFNVLLVAVQED